MDNIPQACQDESCSIKLLTTENKKNEKVNSTEDLCNCKKEGNVLKGSNIALQTGVIKLYLKFVSKKVIKFSRRNLSASGILLPSKGLKLVRIRIWKETAAYVAF